MSRPRRSRVKAKRRWGAPGFAALGNETRLALVAKLAAGRPCSIAQLTQGSKLTRQAITKHLRVLQRAGIVHSVRRGRQSMFAFDPEPVKELKEFLESVSAQWERALGRLKAFVEE